MNLRFPLYAKILFWFFLNLLLLGVIFYGFLRAQFHFGLDSLLNGQAGERVQAVASLIVSELNKNPREEWNETLQSFSEAYKIRFHLFRNADNTLVAGEKVELPEEVLTKMNERRGPRIQGRDFGRPPGEEFNREGFRRFESPGPGGSTNGPPPPPDGLREGPRRDPSFGGPGGPREGFGRDGSGFRPDGPPEFRIGRGPGGGVPGGFGNKVLVHTTDPSKYWVVMRLPLLDRERPWPSSVTLVMVADSLSGGGLFFDVIPWVTVGVGVIFLSVLLWLPLIRGITRSITQMTAATEQLAEGHFETRVDDTRKDELGRLGTAVNRMAGRLSGFVMGQKRFLGDISHELCSPIARMQAALGVLEQRSNDSQRAYVEDVREEVQHMSSLVNELLSFSKAGLQPKSIRVRPVDISDIAKRAVDREAEGSEQVQVNVPAGLHALAEPELLLRAVSNLVRNAIRYAGDAGPITVSATTRGDQVVIMVADSGPGVPEAMLQQIFDPFFRLESSRSRDTGGIGLGLAIVKTCVESCQGTVSVKNLSPSGLQVDISLKQVAEGTPPEAEKVDGRS